MTGVPADDPLAKAAELAQKQALREDAVWWAVMEMKWKPRKDKEPIK